MSSIYDVDEDRESAGDRKIPNVEHDIRSAKMFLQQYSPESGDSLYGHLSELLARILSERPRNAVDIFEDYSKKLKAERHKSKTDYLRELYLPPVPCEEAKKFMRLYQSLRSEKEDALDDQDPSDDEKRSPPDLLELFFHLQQVDIGLTHSEIIALNLSIRELIADKPIQNVRFWGKIIGKPKNYYVVEAELQEEELQIRRSAKPEVAGKDDETMRGESEAEENPNENEPTPNEATSDEKLSKDESSEKLKLIFPPLPKNLWTEPRVVPAEDIGTGVNKNIYFVCNSPGIDDWAELPSVTPQQIVSARQIVRFFTGHLDTPIHTFPPFLGTEKNYLRAQIARISAATLVSPIGFFTFGELLGEDDEEDDLEMGEEEEETGRGGISKNRHYEPLPLKELIDPSLSHWCHHSPYILPQGRTVWWDPKKDELQKNDDETDVEDELEDEEEEENEEEENNEADTNNFKKEVGPPLLTPLSEDDSPDSLLPWTARASSIIKSDRTTIAIVRSNIWPGSLALATGKGMFANVYIGMGQKFNPYNYSPPGMPMIQEQYKLGPEVMEMQDPSFEAEEAYRIAHLPPSKLEPLELDGEQEEEDEDEEDDDDEDDED